MSDIVIKVENLSKEYFIGKSSSMSFREAFTETFSSKKNTNDTSFFALNDINFEIKQGDAVGIIGKNGAGKSTLLKILSRITKPTKGRIEINGRVASLLEVGTGFHPELTGRENIFLNGTILGMSRAEVKSKFDEIVAFSGVEKFIDTPVKRYSSGMYVRLAFAVAAHLEPEILIIDEVLAVGDAEFQKKCLGKMDEVSKGGRTVLFVSHNMALINILCNKAILLNSGAIVQFDDTKKVIEKYLRTQTNSIVIRDSKQAVNKKLFIRTFKLVDENNQLVSRVTSQNSLYLHFEIDVFAEGNNYIPYYELINIEGIVVNCSRFSDFQPSIRTNLIWLRRNYKLSTRIPLEILKTGDYVINVGAIVPNVEFLDITEKYLAFEYVDLNSPDLITGEIRQGAILPILDWEYSFN